MEDNLVHEQRNTARGENNVLVGITKTQLVPQSVTRVSLVISCPVTNPMFLSFEVGSGASVGIRIPAGQYPLLLSMVEHAAIVQGPIFASIPAGAETITVWESISLCPCVAR